LFVTNTLDLTISAMQINPASGGLTAVAGSPFASSLTLDACQGISLAATPDGKFLMHPATADSDLQYCGNRSPLSGSDNANCCTQWSA